ncbi:hypothetical protein PLANPX_1663 [Lacipirellula parvula]|uniref:Uncharacterized protein n=1 Tax=Lacipirellula parvula TaxID=2650471 RepID=A0A5K7XB51_9BACT|nr:hypothetical protein PLANPX_1663 [Lacipirellula parvula]
MSDRLEAAILDSFGRELHDLSLCGCRFACPLQLEQADQG